MKIFLRVVAGLLGALLLLLVAIAFSIRNPWDWGMQRSSRFSEAAFRDLRAGDPIDFVIARLGEPLEVGPVSNGNAACEGEPCTPYLFAGRHGSRWMIGWREFYVYVDARNEVRATRILVEPAGHQPVP